MRFDMVITWCSGYLNVVSAGAFPARQVHILASGCARHAAAHLAVANIMHDTDRALICSRIKLYSLTAVSTVYRSDSMTCMGSVINTNTYAEAAAYQGSSRQWRSGCREQHRDVVFRVLHVHLVNCIWL